MASNRPNPASRSDEAARPRLPAERVHPASTTGEPGTVRISVMEGDSCRQAEGTKALDGLPEILALPNAAVWVDLVSPTSDQTQRVASALSLHPLIVEDVLEGNQRAKIQAAEGVVHIVLFDLQFDDKVVATEIDIVLGPGFLLTVHDERWDPRDTNHLRGGILPILKRGPDHLLWAIADDIIDGYFPFADRMGDAIDDVQDRVVQKATPDVLNEVFELKRELIEVRRAVSPIREVFNQLTNRDEALIDPDELVYFRDIYDHVIRLTDELDNYRELTASTLDVYLTQVNNSLSVIMKRLTGVTVILAGIGAVAGIFGMSEAGTALGGKEAGGFWTVTAIVIALAAGAAVILRRIDWI
jgi:magnesium transporter